MCSNAKPKSRIQDLMRALPSAHLMAAQLLFQSQTSALQLILLLPVARRLLGLSTRDSSDVVWEFRLHDTSHSSAWTTSSDMPRRLERQQCIPV
jgi:hypothetical protein